MVYFRYKLLPKSGDGYPLWESVKGLAHKQAHSSGEGKEATLVVKSVALMVRDDIITALV